MKKKLSLLLAAMLLLSWVLGGCGKESGSLTVLDAQGNTLMVLREDTNLANDPRAAYLEIVAAEVATVLALAENSSPEAVLKELFTRKLVVQTAFDQRVFDAMVAAVDAEKVSSEVGCAITDTMGNLLAAYSRGAQNNAATPKAPYSSFKPLSVYLPAIENRQVTWFTQIQDAPYKQLTENGATQPWPSNADGTYSYEQVMICDALALSLNTVAVKVLSQVGVETSMTFLKEKLGIPLVEETQALKNTNAEEILGNIALGYLETGVSPVDMAGYYQIFATGGRYLEPAAVKSITDGAGNVLFTRSTKMTQVADAQACDVMNRMLQGVTQGKGTGTAAKLSGVEVAGKTGTGDDHSGNWFVGLIPGYSCAVWHGQAQENRAAALFGKIMQTVYEGSEAKKTQFNANDVLTPVICCAESGMPIGNNCRIIKEGYLLPGQETQPCNIH